MVCMTYGHLPYGQKQNALAIASQAGVALRAFVAPMHIRQDVYAGALPNVGVTKERKKHHFRGASFFGEAVILISELFSIKSSSSPVGTAMVSSLNVNVIISLSS